MAKAKIKSVTVVNHFGDHACPYCGIMFINPEKSSLKAGKAKCGFCGRTYKVTEEIAKTANENSAKFDKALVRVIKEIDGG